MGTNPPPGPGVGERLEDIWQRIEAELKQAAAYANSNVVPQVRKESVMAMRSMADALRNLADKIEKSQSKGPQE